jgi:hypothetical protein
MGLWVILYGQVVIWSIRNDVEDARKLPVVAPFTLSTLPADEVLVRGSEAPTEVHSEMLLRAAEGSATPKEELLRVSQESKS